VLVSLDKYNDHRLEKSFPSPRCPDTTNTAVMVERDESGQGRVASYPGLMVVVIEGCE